VLQGSHVNCQRAFLLHLAGEVILHYVLFGRHVEESGARVVAANFVLAETNEGVVGKRAQQFVCRLRQRLRIFDRELLGDIAASVYLSLTAFRARGRSCRFYHPISCVL